MAGRRLRALRGVRAAGERSGAPAPEPGPAQINDVAAYVWLHVHDCPDYVYLVAHGGYTYTRC